MRWQFPAVILAVTVPFVLFQNFSKSNSGMPASEAAPPETMAKAFQCRTVNATGSCAESFSCPDGYRISEVKAACNLERSIIAPADLEKAAVNTVEVLVESNRRGESACQIGDRALESGSLSLRSILGQNSFDYSCYEKDKQSGGDCAVRGQVICELVKPRVDAVFTRPLNKISDFSIVNKIVEYLDQVPAGESIFVSVYLFYYNSESATDSAKTISDALKRAVSRGVSVRLISSYASPELDPTINQNNVAHLTSLKKHFSKYCAHGMRCSVKVCGDARKNDDGLSSPCLSESHDEAGRHKMGFNHNKFILISRISPILKNIVLQTSHNFTHGESKKFNDLLVMENSPAMYNAYLNYWNEQSRENKLFTYRSTEPQSGLKGYFFPDSFRQACDRQDSEDCRDLLVSVLNNIKCLPRQGHTVRLAFGAFSSSRSEIFEKLADLKKQGCSVKLIVKDDSTKSTPLTPAMIERIRGIQQVLNSGAEKSLIVLDGSKDNVHSKIILIDAIYADSAERKQLVFTGSHNLTTKSLRVNDEAIVRVTGRKKIYEQYLEFWNLISSGEKSSAD